MNHTPGPWAVKEIDKEQSRVRIAPYTPRYCEIYGDNHEANARLIAAAPEMQVWLEDALDCLKQYQAYGEEMRKIGRGFHATGKMGHSIESVILGCESALSKAKGESREG